MTTVVGIQAAMSGSQTAAIGALLRACRTDHLSDLTAYAVLTGNGNVIAVVESDARSDPPLAALRAVTIRLCAVRGPVRVDGALFFLPRHARGLRMIFFDRDGTWEPMCGNGLRCLTRYAADLALVTRAGTVLTDDGPKQVSLADGRPSVRLGPPREVRPVTDNSWFAFTGVPHLVVFLPDADRLDQVDVPTAGARLRYDQALCRELGHPEGVHVDFAAADATELALRTYEVGVEDETLCCGTGATATAYLAQQAGLCTLPVRLRTQGGVVEVGLTGGELTLTGDVGYLARRQILADEPWHNGGPQ